MNDLIRRILLCLLGIFGLAINLTLLVRRLSDSSATLAGCGAGSGCETVLGSRWSEVLGMPVTVPGLLIYAVLLLSLTRPGRHLLAPVLGMICAAAIWFILVQAMVIRAFCPWCMMAHAVGLTLTLFGLPYAAKVAGPWKRTLTHFGLAAGIGGAGLIAVQVLGPKPATHRIVEITSSETATEVMQDAHSSGEGRMVVFFDGRKGYRVEQLPHLGNPAATHVIIEYFDYTCSACRVMADHLNALVTAYPDDVCVVMLPVPLDRECNGAMKPMDTGRPGSCLMARAALAVWRNSPASFRAFHYAVLADPGEENTRMLTSALLADADAAMADPWIDEVIQANITDWQVISEDNAVLPKLVIGNRRILHGLPPSQEDFIRVITNQLGIQ